MVRNGAEDTDYAGNSLVDRTDDLRTGGFSKSNHALSVMASCNVVTVHFKSLTTSHKYLNYTTKIQTSGVT